MTAARLAGADDGLGQHAANGYANFFGYYTENLNSTSTNYSLTVEVELRFLLYPVPV